MHPPKRAFAGTQNHLVGFRVLTSFIHYIACDGGKFEICNYDVDLEKKRKEAKRFFEFYFDYFYTDGKKMGDFPYHLQNSCNSCKKKTQISTFFLAYIKGIC